jgi:hypothetical protein
MMRKQYLRFLIALIGVAGLGVAAKGQDLDQVVVKIPYEFVVDGKTLPAGTYKVDRVDNLNQRELLVRNLDDQATSLVVPVVVENEYAAKPSFSLEEVGGQFFLSQIKSTNHLFTIPVSHSEIMEAAAKPHSGTTASGNSAGSN